MAETKIEQILSNYQAAKDEVDIVVLDGEQEDVEESLHLHVLTEGLTGVTLHRGSENPEQDGFRLRVTEIAPTIEALQALNKTVTA